MIRLIFNNFRFFFRKNLTIALGIAVGTAIISGALIIGDSVNRSLEALVGERLGGITHSVNAGDRYFTGRLASALQDDLAGPVAAIMNLDAIATADGGQKRIPDVRLYGVDPSFDRVIGTESVYGALQDGEVILSDNLAGRLDVDIGEEIMLRIRKPNLVPLEAPFVSDADALTSIRVTVAGIANRSVTGRFSLKNVQTPPFNIFISKSFLLNRLGVEDLANLLLVNAPANIGLERVSGALRKNWRLEDAGLALDPEPNAGGWILHSPRVFLDEPVRRAADLVPGDKLFFLSYFVNEFTAGGRSTPYSFVSTLPTGRIAPDEIIVNTWLASDLNVSEGDTLVLKYFLVGPLRDLVEKEHAFRVSEVVPMEGLYADSRLMPLIPGLSDAGNCRDWETSIPIDLAKIRKKDEDYWTDYRGTPKAFINLDQAVLLWQNRFGKATQVRYAPGIQREAIESGLMEQLNPSDLGLAVSDPRQAGLRAASNGVDFSQLFLGLSFFLAVSGIILAFLLIRLNLNSRAHHVGALRAIGWPQKQILQLHFGEGILVSLLGVLMGLALTWVYNILVFRALNTIWHDIVLTDSLKLFFRAPVVAMGLGASLVIALALHLIIVKRYLKQSITAMQRRQEGMIRTNSPARRIAFIVILLLIALGLIIWQVILPGMKPLPFLLAGSLILAALLMGIGNLLRHWNRKGLNQINKGGFLRKSLSRNHNRSLSVITLFSIGIFLTIAIGANRKDAGLESGHKEGGTGGFQLFAETTVPILENLNDPEVRQKGGIETPFTVVQMKKQEGDDASCLNLNQVSQPPLLGVPSGSLGGRFTFSNLLPGLDPGDPWLHLDKPLPGGAIPAIADQTVIQWGLGLKIGDTLQYTSESGDPVSLVLVGGLANSIFQGNILVSARTLDQLYPSNSGSRIFLFDGSVEESDQVMSEFSMVYRDHGIGMEPATARLARFNSIENTYLSIFLIMGTLGMLLGTLGLGIILLRNLQERSSELALFRAVGLSKGFITRLIFMEYATLLSFGTLIGGAASIISVIPGILSPTGEISLWMLLLILIILIGNGLAWVFLLSRSGVNRIKIAQELKNE